MSPRGPLARGATVYMPKKFLRTRYFDWINKCKATMGVAVPTILNMFLNKPIKINAKELPHLQFIKTSSAPMPPEN